MSDFQENGKTKEEEEELRTRINTGDIKKSFFGTRHGVQRRSVSWTLLAAHICSHLSLSLSHAQKKKKKKKQMQEKNDRSRSKLPFLSKTREREREGRCGSKNIKRACARVLSLYLGRRENGEKWFSASATNASKGDVSVCNETTSYTTKSH